MEKAPEYGNCPVANPRWEIAGFCKANDSRSGVICWSGMGNVSSPSVLGGGRENSSGRACHGVDWPTAEIGDVFGSTIGEKGSEMSCEVLVSMPAW